MSFEPSYSRSRPPKPGIERRRPGVTLVELLIVLAGMAILLALLLPAVQAARESARKTACRNNLRQLGLALQLYHHVHECFPSGYIFGLPAPGSSGSASGQAPSQPEARFSRIFDAPPPVLVLQANQPGWGWAALLLPFVEQSPLSEQIDFGVPVEDPASEQARTRILPHLVCPSDTFTGVFTVLDELDDPMGPAATSSYAACFGSYGLMNTDPDTGNGLFQRNSRHRQADVTDGVGQTIAIGERASLFARSPWAGVMTGGTVRTTPGAPVYTAITELAPAMVLARIGNRTLNSPYSEPYDFFSPHINVVFFAFADGSVQSLTGSTSHELLHALATRDNGDVASAF